MSASAEWVRVEALTVPDLAFDHAEILERAVARIAERIDRTNIAASLVPRTFTVPELRHVHALLRGRTQDPGNFRRKFERLLEDGIIERAPGKRITTSKPAAVYRFVSGPNERRAPKGARKLAEGGRHPPSAKDAAFPWRAHGWGRGREAMSDRKRDQPPILS
jgi:hypothetical protein